MKLKNLSQVLKAVDLLSRKQGITIDGLAAELCISRRSVYRLMNDLQELNFPLYDENVPFEKQKTWRLEEGYIKKLPNLNIPDIKFTALELLAISLLKDKEELYDKSLIGRAMKSALEKVETIFPLEFVSKLSSVKTLLLINNKQQKDYSAKIDVIDSLTEAILESKECSISYHSFYNDTHKDFNVQPLHIFEHMGGLYVYVYLDYYDSLLTLAVERIETIVVTDKLFTPPQDIKIKEKMRSAFGIVYDDPVNIKLWVSKEQAKYIKSRKYSDDQKIIENEDGSLVITFSTSGWYEVKSWILSMGSSVKVLEPDDMVKQIITAYEESLCFYKKECDSCDKI